MRVAVTGLNGQVALALAEAAARNGVDLVRLGRPDFDLAACGNCRSVLRAIAPDIVVNAGAYTAVDRAETEPELALAVNALGAGHLAEATAALGIPIIQISTDYVFDGRKPVPYVESDATGPGSVYGRTKLEGERRVALANPRHVILRTAWAYSHTGRNFVRTMLALGEKNPTVRVVSDQIGCPTSAADIADAVLAVAHALRAGHPTADHFGVFHFAGAGDTTWAGFANAIFAHATRRDHPAATVIPIATSEYPTPATRPANSRLACSRLHDVYGIKAPFWGHSLGICLDRLLSPPNDKR